MLQDCISEPPNISSTQPVASCSVVITHTSADGPDSSINVTPTSTDSSSSYTPMSGIMNSRKDSGFSDQSSFLGSVKVSGGDLNTPSPSAVLVVTHRERFFSQTESRFQPHLHSMSQQESSSKYSSLPDSPQVETVSDESRVGSRRSQVLRPPRPLDPSQPGATSQSNRFIPPVPSPSNSGNSDCAVGIPSSNSQPVPTVGVSILPAIVQLPQDWGQTSSTTKTTANTTSNKVKTNSGDNPSTESVVRRPPLLLNDIPGGVLDVPSSTKSSPMASVFGDSPNSNFPQMMTLPYPPQGHSLPSARTRGFGPARNTAISMSTRLLRRFRSLSSSQGNNVAHPTTNPATNTSSGISCGTPTFTASESPVPFSLPDPDKLPKADMHASQQISFSKSLNLRNYNSAFNTPKVRKGTSLDYISSRASESTSAASSVRSGSSNQSTQSKGLKNQVLLANLGTFPPRDELERSLMSPGCKQDPKLQALHMGVHRVSESGRFLMLSKSAMRSPGDFLHHGIEKLEEERAYATYFLHSTCYDIMPDSGKLIVVDSGLPVGKAFRALMVNGIRAAPIWNNTSQHYIGILTITDFIRIMDIYYHSPHMDLENVESKTIAQWMEITERHTKSLVFVYPEDSLMCGLRLMHEYNIRRLPVLDVRSGNILHVVTHKRLLKYLWIRHADLPTDPRLTLTLQQSGLLPPVVVACACDNLTTTIAPASDKEEGQETTSCTPTGLFVVHMSTSVVKAMRLFVENDMAALPVVDPDSGRLLHMLTKYDCIHLVADDIRKYLHMTVAHILQRRPAEAPGMPACHTSDTIRTVIERFVAHNVHHLVVVDSESTCRPQCLLTLSHLMAYLILDENGHGSTKLLIPTPNDENSPMESQTTAAPPLPDPETPTNNRSAPRSKPLLRSHLRQQRHRHLSYPNESFPEEDDNSEATTTSEEKSSADKGAPTEEEVFGGGALHDLPQQMEPGPKDS